jgi:hypothetical protein
MIREYDSINLRLSVDPFKALQGLEAIVRRAKLQTAGTIFNKQTQLLAYADDINIVGRSLEAIRNAYLGLEAETAKGGLKINKKKTKYMIAAGNRMGLGIQRRIQTANRCFCSLKKHLRSSHLVRQVLLHGSETWVLTKWERHRLLVFEKNVFVRYMPQKKCTGAGTTAQSTAQMSSAS